MVFDSASAEYFIGAASNKRVNLRTLRGITKTSFTAIVLAVFATSTHAEEQKVYFVGNGFFPSTVYANIGDTIEITNFHTSSAEVEITGAVLPISAGCTNPEWLDDNNLDCDAGSGNNDPALDVDPNGGQFETNLGTASETLYAVVGSGPITLTGQRDDGGTYVDADNDGEILVGTAPDLGGA